MTYYEKLRSPLWQKRRLEIMGRDGFKCVECGDVKSTLSVHHCYYQRGLEPWEYSDSALRTVCDECHALRQDLELRIQRGLSEVSMEQLDLFQCCVMGSIGSYGVDKVLYAVYGVSVAESMSK